MPGSISGHNSRTKGTGVLCVHRGCGHTARHGWRRPGACGYRAGTGKHGGYGLGAALNGSISSIGMRVQR